MRFSCRPAPPGRRLSPRPSAHERARLRDPAPALAEFHTALSALATQGRRRPTISLCMTVANEAATLERAVESVAPFMDAVIIGVDRKSTDETAAIAQRL